MAKQLMFDESARKKILKGMETLASAVRVTMGQTGKHVILEKSWGAPVVTKDGVSVSKEIELPDPFENMGAKLINEAAQKTSDEVGDGTTTATVLAEALFRAGLKAMSRGLNPTALKRGIDRTVEAVVEHLKSQARPVKKDEDLASVARVSANDDPEIGRMIADAMKRVGPQGVITIEEGKTRETVVDVVEGMQFDKGYVSPYFITKPQQMIAEFENCRLFFYEKKLSSARDLLGLLERAYQRQQPLVLIAEDVDTEPLTLLVVNRLQGTLKVAAVKAPGFGDRRKAILEDLAVLTGGKVVSEDLGLRLDQVDDSFLGTAERVTITKDRTTVVGGAGKKGEVKARVQQLQAQIEKTTSNYDREKLEERLAKLTGGVAVIKVGAATEVEMKEKKARVEDALNATKAAHEEGIVTGGGVALLAAETVIPDLRRKLAGDEKIGADLVARALEAPLRQIADNAGAEGSVAVEEVRQQGYKVGFNCATGKYENLVAAGIVDAVKVVRVALQHAASIAGLLLTTELLCTDLKKDDKEIAGAVT